MKLFKNIFVAIMPLVFLFSCVFSTVYAQAVYMEPGAVKNQYEVNGGGSDGWLSVIYNCGEMQRYVTSPTQNACGWPELVQFFYQCIKFGVYLGTLVAIFVIIKTGFTMVTTGSDAELSKAKESLKKVVYGFFFMLCAWLIVKTILTIMGVPESYQLLAPNN